MRQTLGCSTVLLALALGASPVLAHPDGLDANGGHTDRKTGEYHCHRASCKSEPKALTSASATEIPPDVLARIKANIAQEWPGNYSLQKTLVEGHVRSWKKLQRNFTEAPDEVFAEIRDRVAAEWPDQYSLQETLVAGHAKAWRELNQ